MSLCDLKNLIQTTLPMYHSEIHGIKHWERVWSYGKAIAWSVDADMEVVEYFAFLHDCQRWDDGLDVGHGPRAAVFAKHHRSFIDLSDNQFKLLLRAISGHTDAMPGCKAGLNPTLATCWDADRLDIDRVGIDVDPRYLFTDLGQELAYLKSEEGEA